MKAKKESCFYEVTVVIEPQCYNKLYFRGFFIPKKGTCEINKIKSQVWEYVKKNLDFSGAGIDPDQTKKKVTVKSLEYDFVVCEDK